MRAGSSTVSAALAGTAVFNPQQTYLLVQALNL